MRQQKNPSGGDGFSKRVKGVESDPTPLDSTENEHTRGTGAAKASVAVCPPVTADPDLLVIVDAWPALPEPIRAGMLAMVKAAKPDSGGATSVPAKSSR